MLDSALAERGCSGWALLVKFGSPEHLDAIRERGSLRFTPQQIFAGSTDDSVRSDPFEGTDYVAQPKDILGLTISSKESRAIRIPGDQFVGPLRLSFGGAARQICCLYSWTDQRRIPEMDKRMCAFGGSFLLIHDTQAFLDRVQSAAMRCGFDFRCRQIQYRNSTYSGPTGPFSKPDRFAYQREFRLVLTPGRREPIDLGCGSMRDITTEVLPASDFDALFEMAEPSAAP